MIEQNILKNKALDIVESCIGAKRDDKLSERRKEDKKYQTLIADRRVKMNITSRVNIMFKNNEKY